MDESKQDLDPKLKSNEIDVEQLKKKLIEKEKQEKLAEPIYEFSERQINAFVAKILEDHEATTNFQKENLELENSRLEIEQKRFSLKREEIELEKAKLELQSAHKEPLAKNKVSLLGRTYCLAFGVGFVILGVLDAVYDPFPGPETFFTGTGIALLTLAITGEKTKGASK